MFVCGVETAWFKPQVPNPAPLFPEKVAIWLKGGEWAKLNLLKGYYHASTAMVSRQNPTRNVLAAQDSMAAHRVTQRGPRLSIATIKSPTGPWLLIDSTPMLVGCKSLASRQQLGTKMFVCGA